MYVCLKLPTGQRCGGHASLSMTSLCELKFFSRGMPPILHVKVNFTGVSLWKQLRNVLCGSGGALSSQKKDISWVSWLGQKCLYFMWSLKDDYRVALWEV